MNARSARARWARLSGICALVGMWLLAAAPVSAHPLGNASVNIYERVEVSGEGIALRFILDVAEIPALREQQFADTDDDGVVDDEEATAYLDGLWEYVSSNLTLAIGGVPVVLERQDQSLAFPPGQGGLALLRATFDTTAPHPPAEPGAQFDANIRELTFDGVQGWHEIIVVEGDGARLDESSVPSEDITDELTVYPPDMLTNPLHVREASFRYTLIEESTQPSPTVSPSSTPIPTASPSAPPVVGGPTVPADPLVALVGPELTIGAMIVGVLVAMILGAAHAISPGHGKTLVAAYIIGTRANIGQALWLGLTVAITHTAGVLALGVATYAATEWLVPARVVGWLSVVTGALILVMGTFLVVRAWRLRHLDTVSHGHDHHVHPHEHGVPDDHGESGHHHHVPSPTLRGRDVALLGIVGGLIPSTSALLLLLSSVALEHVAFGIVLIVAFGIGMALVLAGISIGIVVLRHSRVMTWDAWRRPNVARVVDLLPVISGVVVIGIGLVLTADALRNLPR